MDTENPAKNDSLQFVISDNSDLHFSVCKKDLPPVLVQANKAAGDGQVTEAIELLNEQAVEEIEQIINDDASRTDIMFMLAAVFYKTRQMEKAERWYKEVLQKEPHALVCFELGNICRDGGRLFEAIGYQRRAIELCPDSPELWTTLAEYLIRTGQGQEGIELLQKAISATSDKVNNSKFLWHLHHLADFDQQNIFDEHKKWASIHVPKRLARTSHANVPEHDRKLHIGYVSPDFCGHSVAYFFEAILDGHNHDEVEIYGYGNVCFPDQFTERFKPKFDYYRNIYSLSDERVVELIEEDEIDILVDLAGHTGGNRLPVFAYKPAPVQVTYLGYPDTTGMEQIDYRLTDHEADPAALQKFYTEKLFFLPEGFLCYKPLGYAPPVNALPAIGNGYVTFGSFNNNCKIHSEMIGLWCQVLAACENSRLLLKFQAGSDKAVAKHYLQQFEHFGISPERVKIHGWKNPVEHLQLYNEVDLCLDTYPYNGTTTTCEALWMGVPTVSLVGGPHASRVGLSILSRIGLEIFAASSPDEFVAKAVSFANQLENLTAIRPALRSMMFNSPLCNAKTFTANLEKAYREMWHEWCLNQKSEVTPSKTGG